MRILNKFWKIEIEILQKTNYTNTWRSRKGWPINIGRLILGVQMRPIRSVDQKARYISSEAAKKYVSMHGKKRFPSIDK